MFSSDFESFRIEERILSDRQIVREAKTRWHQVAQRSNRHSVLGHLTVGSPLTTRHRDHVTECSRETLAVEPAEPVAVGLKSGRKPANVAFTSARVIGFSR